jgi:hypothetical protein
VFIFESTLLMSEESSLWICSNCLWKFFPEKEEIKCPKCGSENTHPLIKSEIIERSNSLPTIQVKIQTETSETYQTVAGISIDAPSNVLRQEIKKSLFDLRRQEAGTVG